MADIIKKVNALGLLDQYTIAKSLGQEDEFCKSFGINIEKGGKAAVIGEIREFGGKKYQKQANGWRPVKKGDQKEHLSPAQETVVSKLKEKHNSEYEVEHLGSGTHKVSFKDGNQYIINGDGKVGDVSDEAAAEYLKDSKLDLSKHSIQELHDAKLVRAKSGVSESDPEMQQLQAEIDKRGASEEIKLKVRQAVKIPLSLTTDPKNKQGESGEIIAIDGDIVSVKFKDGVVGQYMEDAVEAQKQSSSGTHIGDMSKEQKYAVAAKFGIENPEKLSTKELDKQLTDKNIEAELKKFKENKK